MKNLILAMALVTSSLASAVELPPATQPLSNPLRFRIVEAYHNGNHIRLADYDRTRFYLSAFSSAPPHYIHYYNSGGRRISSTPLSPAEMARLDLMFSRLGYNCPWEIEVNNQTLQVEKITPTCNEYSAYGEIPSA